MTLARYNDQSMDLFEIGRVLAKSGFFDDAKSEAQAIVKVLAGQELGFGPIASMTGIHVIKGKVSIGANLIAARIKGSGKYTYRIREHSNTICAIEFFEGNESLGISTFTAADAAKMETKNMSKFPRNMLFARAMSNGARWYCPDVFGGPIYTPDELGATVNDEGEVIEGTLVEQQQPAPEVLSRHERMKRKIIEMWQQERDLGYGHPWPESEDDLDSMSEDELIEVGKEIRVRLDAYQGEVQEDERLFDVVEAVFEEEEVG